MTTGVSGIVILAASVLPLAAGYAMMASGFWISFSVGRFFDLSLGVAFLIGGYATHLFSARMPVPLAMLAATALAAASGWLIGVSLVQPLARRVKPLPLFIGTLAAVELAQALISIAFGPEARVLPGDSAQVGLLLLTRPELVEVVLASVLIVLLAGSLRFSAWGRQARALADNPQLATLYGVDQQKILQRAYAISGLFAGLAGVFFVADRAIEPTRAMAMLLVAMVATILGGASIAGVVLAAVVLASLETALGFAMPGGWKETAAFAVLLPLMIVRARGLTHVVDRSF
jgi:branched-subunit amino acid ABC-type transport system permease component